MDMYICIQVEKRMPIEKEIDASGRKKHERVGLWEKYVDLEVKDEQLTRAQQVGMEVGTVGAIIRGRLLFIMHPFLAIYIHIGLRKGCG